MNEEERKRKEAAYEKFLKDLNNKGIIIVDFKENEEDDYFKLRFDCKELEISFNEEDLELLAYFFNILPDLEINSGSIKKYHSLSFFKKSFNQLCIFR